MTGRSWGDRERGSWQKREEYPPMIVIMPPIIGMSMGSYMHNHNCTPTYSKGEGTLTLFLETDTKLLIGCGTRNSTPDAMLQSQSKFAPL